MKSMEEPSCPSERPKVESIPYLNISNQAGSADYRKQPGNPPFYSVLISSLIFKIAANPILFRLLPVDE